MLDSHEFLRNLALVLGVAAVTSFLFQRLRQPVVFGYLVAGMIVSPHVPVPLVANEAMVQTLSELGVILLMFSLGLEFSLRKLFAVGPTAGVIAVLQTSAMVALGFFAGQLFGWTVMESVYAGAVLAISSTTIIVKAFEEQHITGRFTQVAFGVLIIEDLIAILLLAILTALSAGASLSAVGLLTTAGRLAAFLVALVVIGLLAIPRFMRAVVRLNSRETTLVAAVAICFGGAYLATSFGYSVALGAFLVGSLVAESGEASVEPLVQPVRDVFAAIFFVSVGMLIDPKLILSHWDAVLVFTLLVILGKVAAVSVGAFVAGYGVRTSVQTGMSLAQIGEFSFIIAGVGLATGATRDFLYPVAVAVSAITTLTTPWLIRSAGTVASYVDRRLPRTLQTFVGLYGSWMERLRSNPGDARRKSAERRLAGLLLLDAVVLGAIILGAVLDLGSASTALARLTGISSPAARAVLIGIAAAVGLPFALGLFRVSRALSQALAFRALPAAPPGKVDLAAAPRRAFIVTWQLVLVVLAAAPLLAVTRAVLPPAVGAGLLILLLIALAVAFWRSATNLQGHTRAGAEVIVAALARQMAGGVEAAHGHGGGAASALQNEGDRSLAGIYEIIPGLGEPVSLRLEAGDYAVGRSLAALDLRDATDATILVILREGEPVVLPVGREVLRPGDLLALAGTPEAVKGARHLLQAGPDRA
ncbi:MAG TPA: cation:proton antiporter [Gemmatimonadales bacterium]|nr:cation:proton antiporter [Gemmatimonadales bacterium]